MTATPAASSNIVSIIFSQDEALVLFELLSRFSQRQQLEVQHMAEQRVLWDLQCEFERVLIQPLASDYQQQLDAARAKIQGDATRNA